jgi:hypothetical protein
VQFEMLNEQVRHGLLQETQLFPTKNFVVSRQEMQVSRLEQAKQGETHASQLPEVVLAKVVLGQIFRQVPL